jgi:hypothetical protein
MENRMRSLSMSVVLASAVLVTIPIAAKAQGYDGSYGGSMMLSADPLPNGEAYAACVQSRPVSMQIAHGVVTVAYADWGQNIVHYRGRVSPNGSVQAWHTNGDGSHSILTGQVQQAMFTGDLDRDQHRCPYSVVMSVGAPAR